MENIGPDIIKLTDNRSSDVWEQVKKYYDPTLKFHSENHYMCVTNENPVAIYITKDNYNLNYFAHEILHLQIRIEGPDVGESLIALFRKMRSLSKILSEQSLYKITNSLEHVKIFPLYISLKFDQDEFTIDYNLPKASMEDILFMMIDFDDTSVASENAVETYINLFFSLKANQNPKLDYSEQLLYLESKDEVLYKTLSDFWDAWIKINANLKEDLPSLVSRFFIQLDIWIKNKYG